MFRALAVAFLLVAVGLAIIARSALKQIVQREKQLEALSIGALRSLATAPTRSPSTQFKSTRAVAVVTGANSGIGLSIAQSLATCGMDVILACRSEERGAAARQLLIRELAPSCPGVADRVHLMLVDVANLSSVRAFCGQFQQRFDRLDFLFCNAGVMSIKSYNWSTLFSALFTCRLGYFLETGRAFSTGPHFIRQNTPAITADGVDDVFATHVLGHFAMYRWLFRELTVCGGRTIWTGSRAAAIDSLSVQGVTQQPPRLPGDAYASAKTAQDLISYALDQRGKSSGVRSVIVCPGYVGTDVTPGFFKLFTPFLTHARLLAKNFQVTPHRGSSVLLAVAAMGATGLSASHKYVMSDGMLSTAQRGVTPLDDKLSVALYERCEQLVNAAEAKSR